MIIYKTTNLVNNKIYIGQTNGRKRDYKGSGKILKYAIKKYGWKNFKTEIIIEGDFSQKETDDLEIYYIKFYNSSDNTIGYNITSGGMGGGLHTKTKEQYDKWVNSLKNAYKSEELRNKVGLAVKNSFTPERRKKISDDLRKRIITEETREKLRSAKKGFGSKGKILVYKNQELIYEFISLEQCAKNLHLSLNTIRPILNTNICYKEFTFIRINKYDK